MGECMPKEQYEYIKSIQDFMLDATNMKENEAWSFAFRCWQIGFKRGMTANEYQKLASRTMRPGLKNYDYEHHALYGMASEVGEIQGIYQKFFQGHKIEEEHLKKEVSDLLWFVSEYCTAKGWTLEEVMQLNIDKLKARYPEGFSVDKSLHRKTGDI